MTPCTAKDLEVLVHISRTTFIDAFEALNNPDDFETYLEKAFHPDTLGRELANPHTAFYFVYDHHTLVGYCKVNEGDAQSDIREEEGLELERIYVVKAFQGKQIGYWILEQVRELAKSRRKAYLWLGVWEENRPAIAFYERHGFVKFGAHPYYIGKDKQTDWLMKLDLATLNPS